MEYPSEDVMSRKLRLIKVFMWLSSLLILAAGAVLQRCAGVVDAFEKSGSLLVAFSVVVYFLLDRFEYLTGQPAELFDSGGHVIPKKIMALTEVSVASLGALVALFGNWALSQLSEYLPC